MLRGAYSLGGRGSGIVDSEDGLKDALQRAVERRPGPEDTGYLFDDFLKQVRMWKRG